jgi:hypothetical protein
MSKSVVVTWKKIRRKGCDMLLAQSHFTFAVHRKSNGKRKTNRTLVHVRWSKLLNTQSRQPLPHLNTVFERSALDDASTETAREGITRPS